VLMKIKGYDYVEGLTLDYMHSSSGVAKDLLKLWTDSKHHARPWYIGTQVKVIDEALCQIKVPTLLTRRPRSIAKHLSYWKSSEFRAWILYFSVPLLQGILKEEYLDHWSCYVLGMSLLLQNSVSPQDCRLAGRLLEVFYKQMSVLYGENLLLLLLLFLLLLLLLLFLLLLLLLEDNFSFLIRRFQRHNEHPQPFAHVTYGRAWRATLGQLMFSLRERKWQD